MTNEFKPKITERVAGIYADPEVFFTGPIGLTSGEIDNLYTVQVTGGIFSNRNNRITEMNAWCNDLLGHGGFIMNRSAGLVVESGPRWYFGDNIFWFTKELDRAVFIMRWSGEQ